MRKRHSPDHRQDLELVKARVRRRGGGSSSMAVALQNAAANIARKERREKRRKRLEVDLDTLDRMDRPPHHVPDTTMDVLDQIHSALMRLTPSQRHTVMAVAGQELTYAEAAQQLGISEGTIRAHLRDARQRLP